MVTGNEAARREAKEGRRVADPGEVILGYGACCIGIKAHTHTHTKEFFPHFFSFNQVQCAHSQGAKDATYPGVASGLGVLSSVLHLK